MLLVSLLIYLLEPFQLTARSPLSLSLSLSGEFKYKSISEKVIALIMRAMLHLRSLIPFFHISRANIPIEKYRPRHQGTRKEPKVIRRQTIYGDSLISIISADEQRISKHRNAIARSNVNVAFVPSTKPEIRPTIHFEGSARADSNLPRCSEHVRVFRAAVISNRRFSKVASPQPSSLRGQ